MIIFGTKGYLHQLAILTLVCGACGNPSAHTLRKRVTKFTLFFVPLFAVSTKYGTQCTFCAAETKLTAEQADQLLAQNAAGLGMPSAPGAAQAGPAGLGGQGGAYGQGSAGQQPRNPYQH
ncbi:zinc-ribbon domain-containing protein [Streptomyces yaizuensis]|uniref:Zinc-ribbon domain-containing protein n=1 Tax=Streptomyces yaizuensis TaxID=2989713 RepID=A0ABQ5NWM8_9ACTN|nr:zinc-ribbon domain-containing protein [Streptomyces sp. YSPA8]GLF94642.1 zinc-ribbon domain-containing protein [Streptomyces sp. YSPA8]